ncbi:1-acyl-sn-glycerol-3-phosphate acyltransferase [Prosthecochloris sp. N3]|uniref:1-acyl-sn-glycerol-3-phosphate acyltransferase n=1 Tax=Prosthecochloris ethylica TaxID=2743976 RepID=A0ABR9XPX6_9CHLB|nr:MULTISPECIES: lysophospholipid acyltransferase family protein [Prosthecochloris]MBF0586155.1 1-acyl-sn-glycerol-3-phosphate acyltransferase [Prosthecochloris ethylica]MBF0635861.1 1-acyl-sn-glycerol-3-phosphate acyltransferase [Prosthecochloris ethylica]NUK47464.1 1-acyl-sn-glycerol-3-phosphate acyltransferase [Prosthecochloris ethylica]RNA65011.1 1-acyl-sn-glycerol-3-phosphate acyltransferase [Prosthecochloris sp. ZM_2]
MEYAQNRQTLSLYEQVLLNTIMIPNFLMLDVEGEGALQSCPSPFIVACNHNNVLESLLVPAFLMNRRGGEKISFVVDWMFGRLPVAGRLLDLIDPVYVYTKRSTWPLLERQRPAVKASGVIEACVQRLAAGRSVGIFPEGTRNRDPFSLLDGKPGVGHIALAADVTVLPVGIDYHRRQRKARVPAFGRTIVSVGEPMGFSEESGRYRELQQAATPSSSFQRASLARMVTHRIMGELSRLCGKRYEASYPVT